MARTQIEKETKGRKINFLLLVLDILLIIYIIVILLSKISPEVNEYISNLFSR